MARAAAVKDGEGSALEVLRVFLVLGLTSFGGPVAHLGYFRRVFVTQRRWIREAAFGDLVALCQFLPGPASSQVGFAIGLKRAGPLGALAAFAGFTFPSAILMAVLGMTAASITGKYAQGIIHGLKLVAVAIVLQAVIGMARSLTPDIPRAGIALSALAFALLVAAPWTQPAIIALGLMAGLILCRGLAAPKMYGAPPAQTIPKRVGAVALALFVTLLIGLPLLAAATGNPALARFEAFYRSGALVFGGGHVVLPLLKTAVVDPGWIDQDRFLAGYGLAQAMTGPLFTFSAYLGAAMNTPPNGAIGAALAVAGIFLPGLLIFVGALPFWELLRERPAAQAALRGAGAAVVGVLAAALINPIWPGAVYGGVDIALVALHAAALILWRGPPAVVVIAGALLGLLRAWKGF